MLNVRALLLINIALVTSVFSLSLMLSSLNCCLSSSQNSLPSAESSPEFCKLLKTSVPQKDWIYIQDVRMHTACQVARLDRYAAFWLCSSSQNPDSVLMQGASLSFLHTSVVPVQVKTHRITSVTKAEI